MVLGAKMSKNAHKRRKKRKEKDVPKCEICGAKIITLKEWKRRYYDKVLRGAIPEPKFWKEIKAAIEEESKNAD